MLDFSNVGVEEEKKIAEKSEEEGKEKIKTKKKKKKKRPWEASTST